MFVSLLSAFRTSRSIAPRLRTALLAAGLITPFFASAQNLHALYEAARSYDAAYLSAKALADSARYKAAQAKALLRPSVSLVGSSTRTEVELPGDSQRDSTSSGLTLQARQTLFNRTSSTTVSQAERSLNIAMWDLETAEQDLIVRVGQAYFDVLTAQDALTTTRASKAFISAQLASAKRNFEVGTSTITDTREAQARFDLVSAQEIAAENDLRVKRIALDQLVGRSDVNPSPLAPSIKLPETTPSAVEAWVEQATTHPAVQRAQLTSDIARLETSKARSGHLPTLDAVASYGSSKLTGSSTTAVPGTTKTAAFGVQLNVPLFAGFSVQNRVKESLLLEDKARNDLDAVRRTVAQATRTAFFSVESGRAQVTALEAAESSSKLALDAIQLGYKVGVRVNLDVLNAQNQLATTRRDLAKAQYDFVLNGLKLRQAAGLLKPADVAAANQLLAP